MAFQDDESEAARVGDPLRVLVVEDEPLLRWAIAETLSMSGASVTVAGDAAAALQAVGTAAPPFDVALLDLCLPDSRDLGLLSTIRQRCPNTAAVIMTAHAPADVLEGARALGVQAILAKPFDLSSLPATLWTARQDTVAQLPVARRAR